jgi:predicted MFS family arabinose efflux permease
LGAALGGVLADHLTIEATLLVMSIGVGLSALIGCFTTLRSPLTRAQLMASATADP